MPLPPLTVICDPCHHRFTAVPTRSFLGFQRVDCELCRRRVVYPLTNGYRAAYWIIGLMMGASAANSISQGGAGVWRGLGAAMWILPVTVALLTDMSISARLSTGTRMAPAPETPSGNAPTGSAEKG